MLENLVDGSADMIISGLAILIKRYEAIDYLVPIRTRYGGVFVKRGVITEGEDFDAFTFPFAPYTWILFMFSGVLFSIFQMLSKYKRVIIIS